MKNTTATANTSVETFIMPLEASTRILSNPKNRTTGKLRRRAWAAREKIIPNIADDRSRTGSEKLQGRLKLRRFRQLLKWERRIAARIKVLEKIVATLTGVLETASADTLRARIAQMHAIGSLIQEELDTRG